MNRLRKNYFRSEQEIDTGPLNDILFILLMFFLFISTLANPNLIRMAVPKAASDTKNKQSAIVSLDKNGNYYIGSKTKAIPKDSLYTQLQQYLINANDTTRPSVIINGDSSAIIADMVHIMRIAKRLGATASLSVTGKE